MDLRVYGMILFNGDILINRVYYNLNSEKGAFQIFFTLLHELMHALSRLLRGDDSFFLSTEEFLKRKGMYTIEESGNFFDQKILLDVLKTPEITLIEAGYLLEPKNYYYNDANEFKKKFLEFKKKNSKVIRSSPKFHIGKTSSASPMIGGGCLWSLIRNTKK